MHLRRKSVRNETITNLELCDQDEGFRKLKIKGLKKKMLLTTRKNLES